MKGTLLQHQADLFNKKLNSIKTGINPPFTWYPYGSLNNFIHLKEVFNKFPLDTLVGRNYTTLDIGAADGDLSFFLESLGYKSDIIDFPPTNYNGLQGAKKLKEHLNSKVNIYERDLDSQFPGLPEKYGLIFFLGILYHLKNPYYVLETLSQYAENLLVSTRVAKYTPDGTRISNQSVAYLLAPDESNNDATNFWIFSEKGLRRIFDRTGWDVTEFFTVGDTEKSNPADNDHDERAFALLKSRHFKS